jgi:hypothetical protein
MARAGEIPPADGKPLSVILKSVEGQKLGAITSVEFDDGWWEVKVGTDSACHKVYINPKSGEEKRRRTTDLDNELPPSFKPLSVIVESVEERNWASSQRSNLRTGSGKLNFAKTPASLILRSTPSLESRNVK